MSAPSTTFHWRETELFFTRECREYNYGLEPEGRWFQAGSRRFHPPRVFPIPSGCRTPIDYLTSLGEAPGEHLLILMQAGAASLGRFRKGECLATKSFKRYVVRGRGRAQPTHLKSKGKSRYGSRLRLQNAQRLLDETSEHLHNWQAEFGSPDHIFTSCPVRLWPSLFQATPPPPFGKDGPFLRIPKDLPRPTTDVLLRAYIGLSHGRLDVGPPASSGSGEKASELR